MGKIYPRIRRGEATRLQCQHRIRRYACQAILHRSYNLCWVHCRRSSRRSCGCRASCRSWLPDRFRSLKLGTGGGGEVTRHQSQYNTGYRCCAGTSVQLLATYFACASEAMLCRCSVLHLTAASSLSCIVVFNCFTPCYACCGTVPCTLRIPVHDRRAQHGFDGLLRHHSCRSRVGTKCGKMSSGEADGRKLVIAVDDSDVCERAVKWALENLYRRQVSV